MTQTQRGCAVIFGCAGLRLTTAEKRFLRDVRPWGGILFARNIDTPDQVAALTAEWRQAVGYDLPILIDQEGGRVQRLRAPFWRDWTPALDQGAQAVDPVRAMYLRGRIIATELRGVGVDVNCAPVADIACDQTHPILRNRCYGLDAASVTARARAMADGLLAGGVLPVLKHMPGQGRADLDSHLDLPVVDSAADDLMVTDFVPFKALADLPLAMTAHVVYSQIDADAPATTSLRMIALMRDKLGFGGLLMSDDISMQALRGPVATRAQAALAAGCDLVLHCNGDLAEMQALADTCPDLTELAIQRSQYALGLRQLGRSADVTELFAQYEALFA